MPSSGLFEDWFLIHEYTRFYTISCTVHLITSSRKKMFNPPYLGGSPPLYIIPPCILTLHLYSRPFSRYLSHQSSTKGGRRVVSCEALFRCHFLIIATDKVGAGHSMQRGEAYLSRKLPPTILTPLMVLYFLPRLS